MGFAGSLGFLWFVLGALGPAPPARGWCPRPLNGTHCGCPRGYEGPPWERSQPWEQRCEDINECVGEGPPPCPPSQSCHNTEGGFRCECNRGYRPGTPPQPRDTPGNGTGTPGNGVATSKNGTGTTKNGTWTPGNGGGTPKNGTRTTENGIGTPENGVETPKNGIGTTKNGIGTPGNGGGTPKNGTGTTENGIGTPGNGGGTPKNGIGTPGNGAGTPRNGEGTPENGIGTPGNGGGTPKNGTGTTKNGTWTPGNGGGTPKNGTGTTKNGTWTPGNGGGTPKNGTRTIENGIGTPENGEGTPENGIGTPENGAGTPKNGEGTPKNGIGTPGNGEGSPENGVGTTGNGIGTPENSTGTPGNGAGTPGNGEGTPKNGTRTTGNGVETPKNGIGTPKNGVETPENGEGTPKNGTGTPKNGEGTPKNGIGTPGNGEGTPGNGVETPENGVETPENGTRTTENGVETPENGIGTPGNGEGTPGKGTRTPENGPIYCEDVDECAEGGEGLCGGGSVCLNTPGSFECHCPPPARGPPGPAGCPAVPVPPEICPEEEQGCELGETLARIAEELRGGRDPRSVLQELLLTLGGALGGSLAAAPPPSRLPRLSALLRAGEGLARGAGTRLPPGTVTNVTTDTAALSLAVSRGATPGPVTLGVPQVTIEVPPEVALDEESGLSLVGLLTLGGLPEALSGGPPVLWGGWGRSLPRPPRRGRPFPSFRVLSPVGAAFVTREAPGPPRDGPAVTLSFRHPEPEPRLGGTIVCAFWNPREGRWDTGGCRVVPPKNGTPAQGGGTVCDCEHLTSFAVLLAFNEIQDHWLLDLVTRVALSLSLVALVAAAATFALCRAVAEPRRTLQLHLSLSLLGGHLAFLLGIDRAHSPVSCTVTAVSLHLSYLSAFCWMALQGAHLYVLLVQVFMPTWLRPRPLLALGYGPAVLIVALCWLSLERGFRWSFRGPVIVITAANAVILVVTLWKLVQKFHEVTPDMGKLRRARVLWVTSLGQLSLLGSGWALGLGAGLGWAGGAGPPLPPGSAPPPLPLLFCAVNAAQGMLIFLCHCLGHPKVRAWYRSLLCPRSRPYSEFTSNTSNTSNHTSMGRLRGSQSHQ